MAILQITINVEDAKEKQWFSRHKLRGNWIVDWGDGCIEVNRGVHCYEQSGLHQITVKGDFEIPSYRAPKNIISLGEIRDCNVTNLRQCFIFCIQLVLIPKNWDVSKVTDMESMFEGCVSFNQDLSHWSLEEVDTRDMFDNCPIEEKHKPKGLK